MAVTVNSDHYRAMLNEFLFTKIEEEDIDNIWFQEDGATCNTAEATLDVLRPVFEDRIMNRRADDFTPLDYYLWCAVKDKYYATSQRQLTFKRTIFVKLLVKYCSTQSIMCLQISGKEFFSTENSFFDSLLFQTKTY